MLPGFQVCTQIDQCHMVVRVDRCACTGFTRDMNTTQNLSSTMVRIDKVVRAKHEDREGHPCEGYWTERTYSGDKMTPRQFVPTCCGRR